MEIADYIVADDRQLVARVLEGDDAAFEYLFNRYRDAIYRLFVQRLGGVNDADDLLQETFIKVYINLHRYSTSYTFGQWVYTIARNTFIDFVRRRQEDLPIDDRFTSPASSAPTPDGERHQPSAADADRALPRAPDAPLPATDPDALLRGVLLRGDRRETLPAAGNGQDPDPPGPGADVPPHRAG